MFQHPQPVLFPAVRRDFHFRAQVKHLFILSVDNSKNRPPFIGSGGALHPLYPFDNPSVCLARKFFIFFHDLRDSLSNIVNRLIELFLAHIPHIEAEPLRSIYPCV